MDRYLFLLRYSEAAALGMLGSGSGGANSRAGLISALEGTPGDSYPLIGNYDEAFLVDSPDANAAFALEMALTSRGYFVDAHRAIDQTGLDSAVEALLEAGRVLTPAEEVSAETSESE
jgi:uncharacterized protein with GYD domain